MRFNQNYGAIGLLDRLHGTDAQYRASPQCKLARVYCSLDYRAAPADYSPVEVDGNANGSSTKNGTGVANGKKAH